MNTYLKVMEKQKKTLFRLNVATSLFFCFVEGAAHIYGKDIVKSLPALVKFIRIIRYLQGQTEASDKRPHAPLCFSHDDDTDSEHETPSGSALNKTRRKRTA